VLLLTIRDLRHRAVRFIVVTVLTSVVLALLFLMTGLVEHFHREPHQAVAVIGADRWILPVGISGPFTASATLPADVVASSDPTVLAPVVVARGSLAHDELDAADADEVVIIGHLIGGLGSPDVVDGRAIAGAGEIVIDRSADVDVGDAVVLSGAPFTVVGLVEDATVLAGFPLAFVDLGDAQDLAFQTRAVVSAVLVDGDAPEAPAGTRVVTSSAVADDALGPLENAIASVELIRFLLWVVAAIIIGAVVYLSALERHRDFAVLRAIGASNRRLAAGLALQGVLVALVAVALAAALQVLLRPAFPLRVQVPARAYWQLPLLAVALALVTGMAGMRRVARTDPAAAFAGPGA
jgi:putative ABC transport system permease protein